MRHRKCRTRDDARRDIFDYVEIFYNRERLHSSLGYLSPADYGNLVATKQVDLEGPQERGRIRTGKKFDKSGKNENWFPWLEDYRTSVSTQPERVLALVEILTA